MNTNEGSTQPLQWGIMATVSLLGAQSQTDRQIRYIPKGLDFYRIRQRSFA